MIYPQTIKINIKIKKAKISRKSERKSKEKHARPDLKQFFFFKWCDMQQRESDGFISKGHASGRITNSSERHTARSSIGRAARVWTQELVCPNTSHRKLIF
jgi:hypothetical protein